MGGCSPNSAIFRLHARPSGRRLHPYLKCFFSSPVLSDPTLVFLHGSSGRHPVERLHLLAVFLDQITAWLVMSSEHPTDHDKVSSSTESFRNISRACATTILQQQGFNSLWPSDKIWWYRSEPTLAHAMACCLTAPSLYLSQCYLLIFEVLWHSPESSFTVSGQATILYNEFEKSYFYRSGLNAEIPSAA